MDRPESNTPQSGVSAVPISHATPTWPATSTPPAIPTKICTYPRPVRLGPFKENTDHSTGIIASPRAPPHRFLLPSKSCLDPKTARSKTARKFSRPIKGTRFASPNAEDVSARCLITGRTQPKSVRSRKEYLRANCKKRKALKAQSSESTNTVPGPATALVENRPLPGPQDVEFGPVTAAEFAVDTLLETAQKNARLNMADCPIPNGPRWHRSGHPAVVQSRPLTAKHKPLVTTAGSSGNITLSEWCLAYIAEESVANRSPYRRAWPWS